MAHSAPQSLMDKQMTKNCSSCVDPKQPVLAQLSCLTPHDYQVWMKCPTATYRSLRLFHSGALEAFTVCRWWLPAYIYGALSLGLILMAPLPSFMLSLFALVLGWCVWWLLEYSIHRWLFHMTPSTQWQQRLHFLAHGLHHKTPRDSERLVMPPLLSAPVAAALVLLAYCLIPHWDVWRLASAAGLINYSCVYEPCHYWSHVISDKESLWPGRLLAGLRKRHMRHHYHDDSRNFCISPNPMDCLLRTVA